MWAVYNAVEVWNWSPNDHQHVIISANNTRKTLVKSSYRIWRIFLDILVIICGEYLINYDVQSLLAKKRKSNVTQAEGKVAQGTDQY